MGACEQSPDLAGQYCAMSCGLGPCAALASDDDFVARVTPVAGDEDLQVAPVYPRDDASDTPESVGKSTAISPGFTPLFIACDGAIATVGCMLEIAITI